MNKKIFNKKFQKKKPGKFSKNKQKTVKPKVKKSLLEDEEIKKLRESYESLPDSREIKSFDNFPISKKTRKGLLENKYRVPTEIQKQSIGLALQGKDILGAAQTGSGKTLGGFAHVSRFTIIRSSSYFSVSRPNFGKSLPKEMDPNGRCWSDHHLAHEGTRVSNI